MTSVLHVMHTWGHPSHTFVRAIVTGVPGTRPVVLVDGVAGPAPPRVVMRTLGPLRQRLPRPLAGKAAVLYATGVGRRAAADLIHSHFAHEVLLADRLARLLRRPHVVSLHGRDLLVEVEGWPAALAAIERAAAVVVPSRFLAEAAVERGVDERRIAVIPSGVDLSEICFRERKPGGDSRPLVLFIGRFVEKKGVLQAAGAIAAVADHRPVRARFVGSGELRGALEAALRPLGEHAEVVDGADRQMVVRSLAEADILISPSRTSADGDAETLLVVNIEAQAAGVPVLTTDHGGIVSALGEGAASVVAEGDDAALAAALTELIVHPERWPAMGHAGRAHVEGHLTVRHTGDRMAALYAALVAGQSVPASLRAAGSSR